MNEQKKIINGLKNSKKPVVRLLGRTIEKNYQFIFSSGKGSFHKDYSEYSRQAYSETYDPDAMTQDHNEHHDHADHNDYSESATSHTDQSYSESSHHTDSNAYGHSDYSESYTRHQDN